MASDEARKKWGTIFMGEREASVEQLDAMQEPLRRDKIRKEQTEDYMERVRKRAADRAREILGAAYTERLKVLDEARADAEASKRAAARECQKLKSEGEALKKEAAEELEKARQIREEAERIRGAARAEGLRDGMDQAAGELREFRAELGQSLARVLQSLGDQRKNLVDAWRGELCDLTCSAAAAGAGYLLQKEHKNILNSLVIQALHQLENRSTITIRVNPEDESTVVDMFQAAREYVPDIRQWIVTPDDHIEPGGFVAESGAGRVDCRRQNFREMVDNILAHLTLPILESEEESARAMQDIVDEEAARIAGFAETPIIDVVPDSSPAETPAPESAQGPEVLDPEEIAAAEMPEAANAETAVPEMPVNEMSESANTETAAPEMPAAENVEIAAPEMPDSADSAPGPEGPLLQDGPVAGEAAIDEAALDDEPAELTDASTAGEALLGYAPVDVPDDDEDFADAQPTEEARVVEDEAPRDAEPTLAELEDELFTSLEDMAENVANEIPQPANVNPAQEDRQAKI